MRRIRSFAARIGGAIAGLMATGEIRASVQVLWAAAVIGTAGAILAFFGALAWHIVAVVH